MIGRPLSRLEDLARRPNPSARRARPLARAILSSLSAMNRTPAFFINGTEPLQSVDRLLLEPDAVLPGEV